MGSLRLRYFEKAMNGKFLPRQDEQENGIFFAIF